MHTIAVIAQKGGSGKTTLALALAVSATRAGRAVVVIDVDPQGTAAQWGDRRGSDSPPSVISAQAVRLPNLLQTAEESGADLVIIDTPPHLNAVMLNAARVASALLIPCRPSVFDLDTVRATLDMAKLAGDRPIAVILNDVPPRGPRQEQATDLLRQQLGVAVCPTALGHRAAFADAVITGRSAQEYDPHGKAAAESQAVYKYVCQLVGFTTRRDVGIHV